MNERYIELISQDRETVARLLLDQLDRKETSQITIHPKPTGYRVVIAEGTEPPLFEPLV